MRQNATKSASVDAISHLFSHLPVADDDVLVGRQFPQPARAAGVELVGADADLRPEAQARSRR